jgi:hypothetical protein
MSTAAPSNASSWQLEMAPPMLLFDTSQCQTPSTTGSA